jgi:hypothetical protein
MADNETRHEVVQDCFNDCGSARLFSTGAEQPAATAPSDHGAADSAHNEEHTADDIANFAAGPNPVHSIASPTLNNSVPN